MRFAHKVPLWVINTYVNRQRTKLVLGPATSVWTNAFARNEAGRLTNVPSTAGSLAYMLDGCGDA
jgi:hypothetical protein